MATIINDVEIITLRGVEDSLHHSVDTIECVNLFNEFNTLGAYRNPYFDYIKNDSSYIKGGGVQILFQDRTFVGVVKNKDSLTVGKIKEIEALTGMPINPYTGSIYYVEFFASSIPSLIPTYPQMKADKPLVRNDTLFSKIEYVGNLKNIDGLEGKILISKTNPAEGVFIDAIKYKQTTINQYESVELKYLNLPHPLANTLNFFTACDLSQYTYMLTLKSDMYIKHLSVGYNVPVEVGNQMEGLYVGVNNFGINDADMLNNKLLELPMGFLVKLPSMANLQQIRSIILTALVPALFTLFCSNLFYRVRKVVMYNMLKRRINISGWVNQNSNSLKDFKFLLSTIILVILLLVLMFVCSGLLGYTFLIDYGKTPWIPILSLILIITIASGGIYYLYKVNTSTSKKMRAKKKKKKKNKLNR